VPCKPMVLAATAIGALLSATIAATGADYSNASVKGTRILEGILSDAIPGALLLSPGGTLLLHYEGTKVCTYDLVWDPAELVSCHEPAKSLGRAEEFLWSPGGAKLVLPTFSGAILAMRDTDIVVLDPDTWSQENLTEDDFDDYLFGGPALWDFSPQWVDDDTLMFIRYDIPAEGLSGRGLPSLVQADIGGEVIEIFAPLAEGRALVYGLALSSDRQRVAFILDYPDSPKFNGVHVFEIGGKAPRRIAGVDDFGGLIPFGLTFSADGRYLLALREHPEQNAGAIATVVNLETGVTSQVTAPGRTVFGAAWSPTGSALAYVAAEPGDGPDDPGGLYIADPPDGPGRLVLAGPYTPPTCCGNQPFVWSRVDTMVLGNLDDVDKPVLVELAR
jgi:hypothetical protein